MRIFVVDDDDGLREAIVVALQASGFATDAVASIAAARARLDSDRGKGLPDDLVEKGIERFRSEASGGTGLGLSIALRIAELHGGSLRAEKRQGGGTVMSLSLPVETATPGSTG
jgi:signal transduction histidine kinase